MTANDRSEPNADPHRAASDHDAHALRAATFMTLGFMFVEIVGGWMAHSLALLADAGHMFTDAAALALAWGAVYFARRAPDAKRSFGYQRLQVLAAFVNGLALLAIVVGIAIEAIRKLLAPAPINAHLMLGVAALGAVVNLVVFAMLRHGDRDGQNMNVAAAILHVLGDLLGSIGAVIGAIVIIYTGFTPIDAILSLLLCALIVRSAWMLVRKSTHILLEGAPEWLNVEELVSGLRQAVPAIQDVHHVHCWSLSPNETLLTLHATIAANADVAAVLQASREFLRSRYGITHSTVQIEPVACVETHGHACC